MHVCTCAHHACMYMHVHCSVHLRASTSVCVCRHIHVHILPMHICIHTCVWHICLHAPMQYNISVFAFVCVHVCLHTCTNVHVYILKFQGEPSSESSAQWNSESVQKHGLRKHPSFRACTQVVFLLLAEIIRDCFKVLTSDFHSFKSQSQYLNRSKFAVTPLTLICLLH